MMRSKPTYRKPVLIEAGAPREHAKLWVEENQLGRRNLSDDQRARKRKR
jgi:hypothetical protein